jgi:RNA recognition motif-containing protein
MQGVTSVPHFDMIQESPPANAAPTRFAFVDFTSTEHATAALIHPKNHQLDGRKLVVEYASADAVRRGGGAGPRPRKTSAEGTGEGHTRRKKRESAVGDRANDESHTAAGITTKNSKPQEERGMAPNRWSGPSAKAKVNSSGTRKPRPAPGAALALAKREQVAIVPSQGRRITFDY